MEKSNLSIETYSFKHNNKDYIFYLLPEEENFTSIYLKRKQIGIISLCIGIKVQELNCSLEEFIKDNLEEWVENYDNEIEDLENARLLKED